MTRKRFHPALAATGGRVGAFLPKALRVLPLLIALLALPVDAAEPPIRRYPYPFAHLVTFSADADAQSPRNGAAVHRVINEEIGLPVSDSLWVNGSSHNASSLFTSALTLNRQPSEVDGHPRFGLLLRQWHRGNIDHFHSWQDDAVPPLSERLEQPLRLQEAVTKINLSAPPALLRSFQYRNLRIYFTAPPPPDLSLALYDQAGAVTVVGVGLVRVGRNVKVTADQPPYIVEILTDVPPDAGLPLGRAGPDLLNVARLELRAPSCARGCDAAVTRIDRDAFSRRTVLLQLPWLEAMNVRPTVLTSHGGWSWWQNFGPLHFSYVAPRSAGSTYEHPQVNNLVRTLGNNREEHAFHTDLLRHLGIAFVWSNTGDLHFWNVPVPRLRSSYTGMYDFQRTYVGPLNTASVEGFRRDLVSREPLLRDVHLDDIYCRSVCGDGAQGSVLGCSLRLAWRR